MSDYLNPVIITDLGDTFQVDNGASGGVVWLRAGKEHDPQAFLGSVTAKVARELADALNAAADSADSVNAEKAR